MSASIRCITYCDIRAVSKQRLGKHYLKGRNNNEQVETHCYATDLQTHPSNTLTRNNETSIARQQSCKQASSLIDAVFSAWSWKLNNWGHYGDPCQYIFAGSVLPITTAAEREEVAWLSITTELSDFALRLVVSLINKFRRWVCLWSARHFKNNLHKNIWTAEHFPRDTVFEISQTIRPK
jgi:hypothetical protein